MRRYLFTPGLDRHFLVPEEDTLPAGELAVVSSTGEQRLVDPAAVAPYEVPREDAMAYVRGHVESAVSGLVEVLASALGTTGGEHVDLEQLTEKMTELRRSAATDHPAVEAALRGLGADLHAIVAAVASGQPAELAAARARLEARGLEVGDVLADLSRELDRLRRVDQRDSADPGSADGDRERSLGRRIDEQIARLERDFGSYGGPAAEHDRKQRQEEYRRDARSAIADSLREAGFTPLGDPEA